MCIALQVDLSKFFTPEGRESSPADKNLGSFLEGELGVVIKENVDEDTGVCTSYTLLPVQLCQEDKKSRDLSAKFFEKSAYATCGNGA